LYKLRIMTFPSSEQLATVSPNLSIEMSFTRLLQAREVCSV
jgi:hypothetical protein